MGILGLDKAADGCLRTFMIKPLGGRDKAALNKRIDEVGRVYSPLITRVVRIFGILQRGSFDFSCST